MSGAIAKAKSDNENAEKALLQRCFPQVQVQSANASKDHAVWVEDFTKQIKAEMAAKAAPAAAAPKKSSSSEEEDVEALQEQVNKYKTVLAQTVSASLVAIAIEVNFGGNKK